jgi:hypothetical protein
VTVRHKASGATVRTVSGSAARGLLTAAWDGKDSAGRLVLNGAYTWTLTAQPADGQGAALSLSGNLAVTAGAAAPRDYADNDGVGDVLTLNSSGALTIRRGTGTGTLGSQVSGAGWPTTAKFVPFGDLSGDRCNDVLVRLSSGALRAYRPSCGKAATPSTPYTSLGTSGWGQYDVLTAPGDVSGDGRPDLIARTASTGTVYLYKGTSAGTLSARVKLYDNWKTYKKVVGAGDLNGDGIGDLLAQDTSNNLYRYDGAGSGTFKARVKVFSNWGASYNAVVGVGDITGDVRRSRRAGRGIKPSYEEQRRGVARQFVRSANRRASACGAGSPALHPAALAGLKRPGCGSGIGPRRTPARRPCPYGRKSTVSSGVTRPARPQALKRAGDENRTRALGLAKRRRLGGLDGSDQHK